MDLGWIWLVGLVWFGLGFGWIWVWLGLDFGLDFALSFAFRKIFVHYGLA